MKAREFSYERAASLAQALDLLERHGSEARLIAGGQSLVPALNLRLAAPDALVDIAGIEDLRGIRIIERDGAARLRIGALVRHAEIERSPVVAEAAPLLRLAVRHVAYPAVRNRGTFGGSTPHADPAAEFPACVLALEARIHVAGRDGERRIGAQDFFLGPYETAIQPGEILTAVEIDAVKEGWRSGFAELRRSNGWAMVGLAMHGRPVAGRTLFETAAAGFFCVGERPMPAHGAMAILCDATVADADRVRLAQDALAGDLDPPSVPTLAAATCLHLARVLLGRVVAEMTGTSAGPALAD